MKCPCGFEDNNQENFDFHQSYCSGRPLKEAPHVHEVIWSPPRQEAPLRSEVWTPFRLWSSLKKLDKVALSILLVSFFLALLIKLLGWD